MLFENTIVGPIHSRRLGQSLGVNLLPLRHKHCSYDCVYCECGWNSESEHAAMQFAQPDEIAQLLEQRLQQLSAEGAHIDSFTFAGNGEPTMYPHFAEVAAEVVRLRNRYYPEAVTTLLTNATQLVRPEIFAAVQQLDNPVLKLDAGTERMCHLINRGNELGCTWQQLIDNLTRFGSKGIIQTLLFEGQHAGERISNIEEIEFAAYVKLVKNIRPRYVMLYSLDRATPEKALRKLSVEKLQHYADKLQSEGIETKVYG